MTTSLTINKIPDYLKDSELYKNIESDESFEVPDKFFRKELVINTFDDFVGYLVIFDYWMLDKYPKEIYIFIIKNKNKIDVEFLNEQFPMNELIPEIKIIIKTLDKDICNYFSSVGNLECLKYCHENGYLWDIFVCYRAAEHGQLECLKYAHENGCEWDDLTCTCAATNGQLECLKYAHENGCPWDEYTSSCATTNGQLECLKYAHENGCSWDQNTCYVATKNGHLECLKYAHENGCEWLVEETCYYAAKNGHLECLKYVHENGCEWLVEEPCRVAAENGHLECLKYVREKWLRMACRRNMSCCNIKWTFRMFKICS